MWISSYFWCMKVQEAANSAATRTFDPRAVGTQEFSLSLGWRQCFSARKIHLLPWRCCPPVSDFIPCTFWMALLDYSFNTLHEFWFILDKQSGSPSFLWHSLLQKKGNKFPKSLERIYSPRQGSDTTPLGSAQICVFRPMPPAGRLLKKAQQNIFKMSSLGLFLCIP